MERDECGGALHEIPMRQALWRSKCYIVNTDSHLVLLRLLPQKDTGGRKYERSVMRRA